MSNFPTTIILRHRKENLKKCSLRGLEQRPDMHFITYPFKELPDLSNYCVLTLDAEELSEKESDKGIFLIDATWKHAKTIASQIPIYDKLLKRSLPSWLLTAYPRRQDDCIDPQRGLASIEALFAAYHVLKRDKRGLLDLYYWKEDFLKKNPRLS